MQQSRNKRAGFACKFPHGLLMPNVRRFMWHQTKMIRYLRNLTVLEWLVIAAIAFVLGSFAWDEVRVQHAERQGAADARRDIKAGNFHFRIGGKQRPWLDETETAFRERCGADLVRSYGCVPSDAECSYDSAYNDTMAAAIADRIAGFRFDDTYEDAVAEGRERFEARLAGQ